MEKTVLITNLLDLTVDAGGCKVRTHANALVLWDRGSDEKSGPRFRALGFHNEAGNPTFDIMLPSIDWSIEPQSYWRSFVLTVAGLPGVRLVLTTDYTNDLPLDIERLEGAGARTGWSDLLLRKVLRYYHAPYFILGQQVETERARRTLGVEGACEV